MIKSEISNQAGRKEQRMRNIVVVLAMFVCTSICLGWQQEIIIDGDIGDTNKVRVLEQQLRQQQQHHQLKQLLEQLESQMPLPQFAPQPEPPPMASVQQRVMRLKNLQDQLQQELERLPLEQRLQHVPQELHNLQNQQIQQLEPQHVRPQLQQYLLQQQLPHIELLLEQQQQQLQQQLDQLPQQQRQQLEQQQQQLQQQLQWVLDQQLKQLDKEHHLPQITLQQPLAAMQLRLERLRQQWLDLLERLKQPLEQLERQNLEEQLRRLYLLEQLEPQLRWLQELERLPLQQQQQEYQRQELEKQLELQSLEQREKQLESVRKYSKYSDIAGNGIPNSDPDKYKHGKALTDGDGNDIWKNPNNNRLIISNPNAKVGNAYGAKMNKASVVKNKGNKDFLSMTNNAVIVSGGKFGCDYTDGNIAGAWADDIDVDMNISSNTVIITGGTDIKNVFGGFAWKGTVSSNTVTISSSVTVRMDVFGARIGDGLASSNTVTITSGKVGQNVCGGCIIFKGTATLNTVNLTSVTVSYDVYGAWIEDYGRIGDGLASSNTVTITSGKVRYVYGGYIFNNGTATLNTVNLTSVTVRMDVYGAKIGKIRFEAEKVVGDGLASSNTVTITSGIVGQNVYGGFIEHKGLAIDNKVNLTSVTVTKDVYGARIGRGLASSNTVTITSGTVGLNVYGAWIGNDGLASSNTVTIINGETVKNVYGGYIVKDGTATLNKVNLTGVTATKDVYGAWIGNDGLASSNTVTITSGTVGRDVYGGYIVKDGTATLNKVNLTGVTATKDVYGAWIGGDGLASSNTVTIINGEIVQNVYGGYIVKDGTATGNTVTINGGKVKGNVFGGYVCGNGEATYNTINITAAELCSPEFSPESILCGGICADADTNDAFTGNTLNIETKGIEVKGISNFEEYKFHLKDIKPGETILTATSGGCSWSTVEYNYTPDCEMDLSRSNISLHTQGVINKGDYCILIKSPKGFKDNVKTKQCDFENEGLLIKYYWDIKIADNKQELIAKLIDKKIRDEGIARSLSEGYGAGIVCVNNGMDCIFSKMEETEEQISKEQSSKSLLGEGANLGAKLGAKPQRKGEIGAFGGLAASKSKYDIDKGSHIDMIGMSMMGGVGKVVEVREKELTVGVFAEHGTGNSDIHCENKNEGKSSYTGGGLLGRYNIYENEFSGTKAYGEVILRAGQIDNSFNIKEAKKDGTVKEYKYKYADAMYGGCAVGGGYKHKISEKIDLDWSLRYMVGYQDGKGAKQADVDGNKAKFESVTSNRIRIGVRGKYVELEKIKPYAGIGCECELSGKVKGTIQNGVDMLNIPASSFGGVTGIGELGVSGKVWKFGVDISGQGYLGVRKGFGGMLKLKYAFGKDAHGSLASSKASGSKSPRSKASTKP